MSDGRRSPQQIAAANKVKASLQRIAAIPPDQRTPQDKILYAKYTASAAEYDPSSGMTPSPAAIKAASDALQAVNSDPTAKSLYDQEVAAAQKTQGSAWTQARDWTQATAAPIIAAGAGVIGGPLAGAGVGALVGDMTSKGAQEQGFSKEELIGAGLGGAMLGSAPVPGGDMVDPVTGLPDAGGAAYEGGGAALAPSTGSAGAGLETVGAAGGTAAGGAAGGTAAAPAMGPLGNALTQAGIGLGVNLLGQALAPKPDSSAGDAAKTTAMIAKDQWDYYKQHYQPLESNLIDQAQKAGSPEEFAAAAGRANADVAGGFDKANKAVESRLQARGINPASPAYQSAVGSVGLAEGAAHAGAQTEAYNNQKNLAYSKALDVAGLGKGIPAQSAASSAAAANAAANASNSAFNQNAANQKAVGSLLEPLAKPLTGAAMDWYNSPSKSTTNFVDQNDPVLNYAKGGKVGLEALMKKKGMHPDHAKTAITPHMRRKFANGGSIGLEDMNAPSQENQVIQGAGTETSDSIPAIIDGKEPAALSTNEFVMAAPVMKMTGEQILQAINNAGLEMREEAGKMQYAEGGQVKKPEEAPIGSGMAKKTVDKISAKKRYEEETMSAAEEGKQMPSFDEWFASTQHYAMGGKVSRYCHAGL